MKRPYIMTLAVLLLGLVPSAVLGQNREHLQLTADLRMVQEQVSRLQLANNQLAEQLKAAQKRMDDLSDAQLKAFANQQVLINQISSNLATVREKLDDNTVRVSQLTQEMSAISNGMRLLATQVNALVGLLQPPVASATPAADAPAGGTAASTPGSTAPATGAVTLPSSPGRIYDQAFNLYLIGQYDNAIDGFREVIEKYPTSTDAANAQFQIGQSFYSQNKCREALPEYQKVVATYKTSEQVPEAYYMLSLIHI